MRGALANLSFDGSPMYVFTDAGPKDARKATIEEVKMMAEVHGVAINFLASSLVYFYWSSLSLYFYLFIYFEQYLFRGAQFSDAGFNGALMKRKKTTTQKTVSGKLIK